MPSVRTRGQKRHVIALEGAPVRVPDGDGGWTETMTPLDPPTMFADVRPASSAELERTLAGTVIAAATHLVTMDYHAGVTTDTTIQFEGRTLRVRGLVNPEEKDVETIAVCEELLT